MDPGALLAGKRVLATGALSGREGIHDQEPDARMGALRHPRERIEPGHVSTGMTHEQWGTDYGRTMIGRVPMQRPGKPQDLDGLPLRLATDASS